MNGTESGKPPEARIRARNKAKILKTAVHLFVERGFDGTHISEIADQCGLPRANVYYYFQSKEGIYTALIEQVISGWDRAFEHIDADREPREAIADYVHAKLEYSRRNPVESRFFASEMLRGARFLRQRHWRHIREVTRQRAFVVEEWIRQKKLAPVDPHHFFILLWSSTQFYADFGFLAAGLLQRRTLTRKVFQDAANTICRIILDGGCDPKLQTHDVAASIAPGS